jgi:hypothetical protein
MRLELQAQVGEQRHAEAVDLHRSGTSGSSARVAGAERAENREVIEERPMPQHLRTQPDMKSTARGDAEAIGQRAAEGTTEVGPRSVAHNADL